MLKKPPNITGGLSIFAIPVVKKCFWRSRSLILEGKMNWELVGFTLDVLGKVLLGVTVLLAHRRIVQEHRIDKEVLTEMRREQFLGLLGIVLIIIGFLLQLPGRI